jgi:hypothetical protein
MEQIAIAELTPQLPALALKQFRAVVTLIWPYSSSARQFALLFGDPDFRRRQRNGQVRARFSGSSAKAIASTGVGIGDEVVLSLRGAEFVHDGTVNTPGKSIDWELLYTQTLSAHVTRNGSEIATLDLNNVAPTPAACSPVRRHLPVALDESHQWSSPAFIKQTRLSEGPIFEAGYDPFNDDTEDRHDRKRRRKSYKDWNAWTYSARTPSPEKTDVEMEGYDALNASPIRQPVDLPQTPVSPQKPEPVSMTGLPHIQSENPVSEDAYHPQSEDIVRHSDIDNQHSFSTIQPDDNFVRDADYYDLYAGPDEVPPSEAQDNTLEGDAELNPGKEDKVLKSNAADDVDAIEFGSESFDVEILQSESPDALEVLSVSDNSVIAEEHAASIEHYDAVNMEEATASDHGFSPEYEQHIRERSGTSDDPIVSEDVPEIIMPPPPALPLLQTNFQTPLRPGFLTPVGKEPSSPTLLPLDSASLPMPSPFPGVRGENALSFPGPSSPNQGDTRPDAEQQQPLDEEYIESSFYSSVSAANGPGFHESAFTDVRFNFGMDGSAFSRPTVASTSEVQDTAMTFDDNLVHEGETEEVEAGSEQRQGEIILDVDAQSDDGLPAAIANSSRSRSPKLQQHSEIIALSSDSNVDVVGSKPKHEAKDQAGLIIKDLGPEQRAVDIVEQEGKGHLKPGDASEEEEVFNGHAGSEDFEHPLTKDGVSALETFDEHLGESTERSVAATEIIDLGSDMDESDAEDIVETEELPATLPETLDEEVENHGFSYSNNKASGHVLLISDHVAHDDENHDDHLDDQLMYDEDQEPEVDDEHMLRDGKIALVAEDLHNNMSYPTFPSDITEDDQPDMKVESIEETEHPNWTEPKSSQITEPLGPVAGPSAELLIAVPDEGSKVGEMQIVSVAATGPARNTRSKTKASLSPKKEASHGSITKTRSKKSKSAIVPVARTTISSLAKRSTSTTSSTRDMIATSPYSLRSQSKRLSPSEDTTPIAERNRARKQSVRFSSVEEQSPSKGTFSDRESLLYEDLDFPHISFGLSQELGVSQGRSQGKFANVPYVKDSEEGSLRSENSLSTVQYSDDWNLGTQTYTNFSDPVQFEMQIRSDEPDSTKARPTDPESSTTISTNLGANTRWKPASQVAMPTKSTLSQPDYLFLTQPAQSSPSKGLRSMTSTEVATSSPRTPRRTRGNMYDIPPDDNTVEENSLHPTIIGEVIYHTTSVEPEENRLRSSSPASVEIVDLDEPLPSSPPASQPDITSVDYPSLVNSNMPMTPDATQQASVNSHPSFSIIPQQQNMPITPQFTQTSSAGLRSFKADAAVEEVALEPLVKSSPFTKSTPRRNVTGTDIASDQASPTSHSANISDSDAEVTFVPEMESPAIGLSTPIAYYTPLKDLPFFLNRSSQFHSSSNPDVLALVTSASTPSKRATSGPKHHTTTFHITDISSYPSSTTVQVFRPYATALPVVDKGDVVLLRSFDVKSLNRSPMLVSGEESAWCVWRFSKIVWGRKRIPFGELREREEVKGPVVERGEGEWREVERIREWYERVAEVLEAQQEANSEEKKANGSS